MDQSARYTNGGSVVEDAGELMAQREGESAHPREMDIGLTDRNRTGPNANPSASGRGQVQGLDSALGASYATHRG